MITKASRGRLLLLAQRPGKPLGPPPERLSAAHRAAWLDIVAACHDVLRASDSIVVDVCAGMLVQWRSGRFTAARDAYRMLGHLLMPMRQRRRLLFPER